MKHLLQKRKNLQQNNIHTVAVIPQITIIGRIAKKHGYRGEVVLDISKPLFSPHIKKGDFLFLIYDGKGVPFFIEDFRSNALVIKLQDIHSEQDALSIEGVQVALPSHLEDHSQNESNSLVNYQIETAHGVHLGTVLRIEPWPAAPMLVVLTPLQNEMLIPLVEEWVVSQNDDKKLLTLALPDGFTEI